MQHELLVVKFTNMPTNIENNNLEAMAKFVLTKEIAAPTKQ